jgi:hypothetical protein
VEFLSSWCSSDLSETEEDASVEYDLFATVGWILDNSSSMDIQNPTVFELKMTRNNMPSTSYAHNRTSLFVKVIANLHCFVPDCCEGWFFANACQCLLYCLAVVYISSNNYHFVILNLLIRKGEEPFHSKGPGVPANGPI